MYITECPAGQSVPIIDTPSCQHLLQARCQWGLGPNQEALLTSLVFAGMALGTMAWGHLADTRGRRTAFVASVLLTAAAGLASAAAPTYLVGGS